MRHRCSPRDSPVRSPGRGLARTTVVGAIGAALLLAPLGQRHAQADPSLAVNPTSAPATATSVTLSGQCDSAPRAPASRQPIVIFPPSVLVTLDGGPPQTIDLTRGTFADVPFQLPDGLAPGDHLFTTALPPGIPQSFPPCEARAVLTILPPEIPATLDLDREAGQVRTEVTATGTCPAAAIPRSTAGPSTVLSFDDKPVATVPVDRAGNFGPVTLTVPDVPPGAHVVTSSCGARRPFQVLAPRPPTLNVKPAQGAAGSTVTATGTCPAPAEAVTISFGDAAGRAAPIDPGTGAFGPVALTGPDLGLGPVTGRSDCGAERGFTGTRTTAPSTPSTTPTAPTPTATTPTPTTPTAVTPPTGTVTPNGVLIPVPDLSGMTEAEAIAALGDQLRLANPTGGAGRISNQLPPPGTLVEPASAVSVVLAAQDQPSRFPLLVAVLAAGVLVGALVQLQRVRRRRTREHRWLREDVRTALQAEAAVSATVPGEAVAGLDLRLQVHRDPEQLDFQEVRGGHD